MVDPCVIFGTPRTGLITDLSALIDNNHVRRDRLAATCGISRSTLHRIECGSALPDIAVARHLAKIFGLSVDRMRFAGETRQGHSIPEESGLAVRRGRSEEDGCHQSQITTPTHRS